MENLAHCLILCSLSQDVAGLREQISNSNVTVEMDSRKGNDLSDVIAKIRNQYEKAAKRNRDDTEAWYQGKVRVVQTAHVYIGA